MSLSLLAVPAATSAVAAEPVAPAAVVRTSPATEVDVLRTEQAAASRNAARVTERTAAQPSAKPAQRKTRPASAKKARTATKRSTPRATTVKRTVHKTVARKHTVKRVTKRVTKRAAWSGRASGRAAVVLAYARRQLGKPYVFGALDCSGLTQRSFRRVGINLPHKASRQDERGRRVSRGAARAGDLVFWGGDNAYHVAIYIGGGRVIHAPKPGDHVKVSSLWGSYYFVRVLR